MPRNGRLLSKGFEKMTVDHRRLGEGCDMHQAGFGLSCLPSFCSEIHDSTAIDRRMSLHPPG
ncbi:MAG: hypothetical protein CMJ53_03530 [Planctomycetaceae bacterium]|nr:hypothetical protein [Planctomycetaceae bacterium]